MKTIKFVVKVKRGNRAPEYVQCVDTTPLHMTPNPKARIADGQAHGRRRYRITGKLPVHPGVVVRASCVVFVQTMVTRLSDFERTAYSSGLGRVEEGLTALKRLDCVGYFAYF
jgi:hypothetical protein